MNKLAYALMAMSLILPAPAAAAEITPQTFAQKAAMSDMFELESAKLVLEKGKSDKVRTFAQQMIEDHGRSSKELREAAGQDGVNLPTTLDKELQEKLDALKPLSGVQLDAAYVSTQVSVHTEAVELFGTFSKSDADGAIKSFAVQTLPAIRMHLVRIRSFNVED